MASRLFRGSALLGRVLEDLTVTIKTGSYTNGIYNETTTTETFKGVILPLSADDYKYDINSTYTTNSAKLYTEKELELGDSIEDDNTTYTIHRKLNYTDFSTFRRYIIERSDNNQ